MLDWNEIKAKMTHISQFRNLTDEDWNRLCRVIRSEILSGVELEGADQREAVMVKLEQRKIERREGNDRRRADRRDFSLLKELTQEEWDKLCKIVQETIPEERRTGKRRAVDRRNPK